MQHSDYKRHVWKEGEAEDVTEYRKVFSPSCMMKIAVDYSPI